MVTSFEGRNGIERQITHLFADDNLVFCKDMEDHMTYMSWILAWFEALFGLRINLNKGSLMPMGRVENGENLVLELGCKIGSLPTEYLGLGVCIKPKKPNQADSILKYFKLSFLNSVLKI